MKVSHLVLVALIVTSFPALVLAQTSSAPLTRCEVLQQVRDIEGVDYANITRTCFEIWQHSHQRAATEVIYNRINGQQPNSGARTQCGRHRFVSVDREIRVWRQKYKVTRLIAQMPFCRE